MQTTASPIAPVYLRFESLSRRRDLMTLFSDIAA